MQTAAGRFQNYDMFPVAISDWPIRAAYETKHGMAGFQRLVNLQGSYPYCAKLTANPSWGERVDIAAPVRFRLASHILF